MKLRITLLLSVMTLMSPSVFSQYVNARFDLLGRVIPDIGVSRAALEFAFLRHFSVGFGYETGVYGESRVISNYAPPREIYLMKGTGFTPELRYYPFTRQLRAPVGFFIGAYYRHYALSDHYTGEDQQLTSTFHPVYTDVSSTGKADAYGFMLGVKKSFGYITLETLLGIGPMKFEWTNAAGRQKMKPDIRDNAPINGRLEIAVGIMFPKMKGGQVITKQAPSETGPETADSTARVVIYRPRRLFGSLVKYELYDNGQYVTEIKNGTEYVYTARAGVNKFYAKPDFGNSITVNLESGKTYYLRSRVMLYFFFLGHPSFRIMKPEKAKQKL